MRALLSVQHIVAPRLLALVQAEAVGPWEEVACVVGLLTPSSFSL